MTHKELADLLISVLVLGFCLSIGAVFSPAIFLILFPIAIITVGLHFALHELAHKAVAQRFGYLAEFKMWPYGLILALAVAILTGGKWIFAAPGAVYILPVYRGLFFDSRREQYETGIISAVGPLTNLILAMLFKLLTISGGIVYVIGEIGYRIGVFLAFFNLLPIPPLDGSKIFAWKKEIWAALFAVAAFLAFID